MRQATIDRGSGRRVFRVIAALTAASLGAVAWASPVVPQEFDRTLAEETFDAAWTLVHETHFDPTFNGVDWKGVRDELRPRLDEIESNDELRVLIQEMVSRLGQSHFAILSDEEAYAISEEAAEADRDATDEPADEDEDEPAARGEGEVGFEFRLIDGEVVIERVGSDSAAAEAGVRTGWVLASIGEREVAELLERIPETVDERMHALHVWQMLKARLDGQAGRSVELTFRDGRDRPVERTVTRQPVRGMKTKFGNLPTMYALLEHERREVDAPPASVGIIRFNVWMIPIARPFAEAVDELRDTDGIVIDLRGNIGGVGGMVMGTSGHFLDEQVTLGVVKTRDSELKFVSNPRRVSAAGQPVDPYDGPLAILVDQRSASTSEVFTGGMQGIGRARVFGETTMGAALPAMMARLPNGDVLLHAIADFHDPHGRSLEGMGVPPDEIVVPRREDLLAGRDVVLEAAVDWIATERRSGRSPANAPAETSP